MGKHSRKNRLAVLSVALVLSFIVQVSTARVFGSQDIIWKFNDGTTLLQQEDSLLLQSADGSSASFDGTLQSACQETADGNIFLLMRRAEKDYLDLYSDGAAYHGKQALQAGADVPVLQACSSAGTLYVRYTTAENVQTQYVVMPMKKLTVCSSVQTVPSDGWSSVQPIKTADVPESTSAVSESSTASEISNPAASPDSVSSDPSASLAEESGAASQSGSQEESVPESHAESSSLPSDSLSSQSAVSTSQEQPLNSFLYRCGGPMTVTQMQQVISQMHDQPQKESIEIIRVDGQSVKTGWLTTGDVVRDNCGGKIKYITIVIPGDLCGSGHPDEASYQLLRESVAGGRQLDGLKAQAADMTQPEGRTPGGGVPLLDISDLLLLKRAAGL
ncbi:MULTISPECIES: hypothetical protein [Caproicibacterium]|uniref:Uncharacterized protein n=1 Tax=Caproicibacterium lactatifermentans TaxID=2666138 RepID=A0A859DRT1_9FIRM|nr:hypothetical protein [Caproicibacterium lactatifermentans]ARP49727.1 hypothetical protein B6259_01755 [Ruminococcaceae bacterium CPB6]QKN24540.1 hypothetical protein GJQ69_08665 [Caproicibacterium lactatifermentans]